MTVYISICTENVVLQATDQRFSQYVNGHARVVDDHSNKMIIVTRQEGRFLVAFTGLAQVANVRLIDLVSQIFAEIPRSTPERLFSAAADALSVKIDNLAKKYRIAPRLRQFSLSAVGFLHSGYPFIVRISNFEDRKGRAREVKDKFEVFPMVRGYLSKRRLARYQGTEVSGVSPDLQRLIFEKHLLPLRRRRAFHRVSWAYSAKLLARIIDRVSGIPESEGVVGRNCIVVALSRPPSQNAEIYPFSDDRDHPVIKPNVVSHGLCLTGFKSSPNSKASIRIHYGA